jgi:hypothetical protein
MENDSMKTEQLKQHEWLQKFLGEWTYEHDSPPAKPGEKPAHKVSGTESVRSLGGLWIVADGKGTMPDGGAATMLMTLGYDPMKERFVGTWIGSMMTQLWVYDGQLNPAATVLTLDTEGPTFDGRNKLVKYRDLIEFKSDDDRLLRSESLGEDGQWHHFMTARYRRKK